MIHSVRFTCVLDTNVIYPLNIRDILLWFAHFDLYTPKWSKHVFDEWISVMERKGVSTLEINKRVENVSKAFPDAMIKNYESLIDSLTLKDKKDRHVLAAAIKTNANRIVTNNLKDFPNDYLSSFGLCAINPDDFIVDTIDLNHEVAVQAFKRLVLNKKNPPLSELEVLDKYREVGLKASASYLHSLI